MVSSILYKLFIVLYSLGIRIAAIWNPKARKWVMGRKQPVSAITPVPADSRTIWMHCASLGEFEQGRPVLELLKNRHPGWHVVLSFFSPSGYEACKNYPGAEQVLYLPMDEKASAAAFINQFQPDLVLWVKYEFWYYYLSELKKRKIPALLVSGVIRDDQPFFRWYGNIWREMIQCFDHLFLQNESSKLLADKLVDPSRNSVNGDTRFDRVVEIAEHFTEIPGIREFCKDNRVIVAGSTWEEDEDEWVHYLKINPDVRFIIAPHEVHELNIRHVQKNFPGSIRYSQWNLQDTTSNCLIIDNIGMLSRLYKYADITYVGGGFGSDGVHNVLEAAVYGKPVIFGPEYEKYAEATGLIDSGGAIEIENALELELVLNELFSNADYYRKCCEASRIFVQQQAGASLRIMSFIEKEYIHSKSENK